MENKCWKLIAFSYKAQETKQILLPIFLPLVKNHPDDRQGQGGQVEDTGIQPFGGFLAQLLGGTGTNGTLRPGTQR